MRRVGYTKSFELGKKNLLPSLSMTFALREIHFSDGVPYNSYFDSAPFAFLESDSRRTVAIWITGEGYGSDYWAQAVLVPLNSIEIPLDLGEGQIAVTALDDETISFVISGIVEACGDDTDLTKYFIYEDGH
jgi:hypothetical protein